MSKDGKWKFSQQLKKNPGVLAHGWVEINTCFQHGSLWSEGHCLLSPSVTPFSNCTNQGCTGVHKEIGAAASDRIESLGGFDGRSVTTNAFFRAFGCSCGRFLIASLCYWYFFHRILKSHYFFSLGNFLYCFPLPRTNSFNVKEKVFWGGVF